MSYIRCLSPYIYVEGVSFDYVFKTDDRKKRFIEDYGSISNESIVELLLTFGENQGQQILTQMGERLAENLNIKLRKKPLTTKQWLKLHNRVHNDVAKNNQKMINSEEVEE